MPRVLRRGGATVGSNPQPVQGLHRLGPARHARGRPIAKVGAAVRRREAGVGQRLVAGTFDPLRQGVGGLRECGRRLGGHDEDLPGRHRSPRCQPCRRSFSQDHVGVGPAEAERTDAGDPSAVDRMPWFERRGHPDWHTRPGNVRARVLEVKVTRHLSFAHGEHDLDDPGKSRDGLGVADVGFHGADDEGLGERAVGGKHALQPAHFDGITEWGSRAVRLDVSDVSRLAACAGQRTADQPLLALAIRHRESGGATVMVHCRPVDHGENPLTITLGVFQSAENHGRHALAPHVSRGSSVEGSATAVGCQGADLREVHRRLRRQHEVHGCGDRRVGLAGSQTLARLMQGNERG